MLRNSGFVNLKGIILLPTTTQFRDNSIRTLIYFLAKQANSIKCYDAQAKSLKVDNNK